MNKSQIIAEVAEKAKITKAQAGDAVNAVFDSMSDALAKGDKIQLIGFGTFSAKFREKRISRNPRTGEKAEVPASFRPAFSAGKALKEKVAKLKK